MSTSGKIGTDEAGKGDYFGPLVVAAFWIEADKIDKIKDLGVRDSKLVSDNRVLNLATELENIGQYSVVSIGPTRYNELFAKMKNLNRILAWGHARAIENILEKVEADEVISDKFGDEDYIKNALLEKGRRVNLVQKVKAESEPVVAAASILARAEFLKRLQRLSEQSGIELPKGASDKVDEVARRLVQLKGEVFLNSVAKFHFKNTQRILCTKSS